MDNDGKLLECLRNTYKGLRFQWKYRGVRVLDAADIRRVVCNGALAGKLYARYLQQAVGLEAIIAPSTSPANAAWSLARLLPVWRDALGLDMPPKKG